jgi:hypothetical protein
VRLKAIIFGAARWQLREVSGQTGFCSQSSLNAEFGLGDATDIDSIRIEWPSGIVWDTTNVEVDQFLTITEPVQIPTTDLVAYYPFNGNANDESGNGNDALVDGATLAEDRFGDAESAYSFDGVDDVIAGTLGATSGIDTAITTTAWFYQPTAAGHPGKGIVGVGSGANKEHFYQRLYADYGDMNWDGADGQNRLFIGADDGTNDRWWGSNTVITTSEWHFVTTTYSSASREVRIYIDGDFDREVTLSADLSLTVDLFIGCDGHNDNHFEGRIDDIRIYNRVLREAEIQALYHEGGQDTGPDYFVFFNGMTISPGISASAWGGSAFEVETGAGAVPSTNAIKWTQGNEGGEGWSGFHLNTSGAVNLGGLFANADTLRFLYKADPGVGDIVVQFETGTYPDAGLLGQVVSIVADDEWHAVALCLADLPDRSEGADGTQFDSTSVSRLAIFSNANAEAGRVVYLDDIWMGLPANTIFNTQYVTSSANVEFPGTDVWMNFDFSSQTGVDTIEVMAVQAAPGGTPPTGVALVQPRYWEFSHSGEGVFSVWLEFNLGVGAFDADDQANPGQIKLLRRESTSVAEWITAADGSTVTDSHVFFTSITGFSQFAIGRESDMEAPTITNLSVPVSPTKGTVVTVTATVTDASAIQSVVLNYLEGGATGPRQVSMNSLGGDTYSGNIPALAVTEDGLICFIVARDENNNTRFSNAVSIQVQYPSGTIVSNMSGSVFSSGFPYNTWRLISFPSDVIDKSTGGTVRPALETGASDETWKLYRYTGPGSDDYVQTSTIRLGESYFLKQIEFERPLHFTLGAGQSVVLGGYTWTLPGYRWQFISSPYPFPVTVSADQGTFRGPYTYGAFGSGGQDGWSMGQVQTTFRPWGGYIIYNNTDQTQTLESTLPHMAKAIPGSADDSLPAGWLMNLTVEGDRFYDGGNRIGRLEGAREGRDDYDTPEPPLLDECIALTMEQSDWGPRTAFFTTDIRSVKEMDGAWDLALHTRGESGPINLTYVFEGELPEAVQVALLDLVERRVYDLSAGEKPQAITDYTDKVPYRIKVMAGSGDYVQQSIEEALAQLPEEFALSPNYPNPFNPTTTITYALPHPAKASLRVYNLVGQEIITLVNGWEDMGYHKTIWQGVDRTGRSVASGVYIAVLRAEGIVKTRKMVLLK